MKKKNFLSSGENGRNRVRMNRRTFLKLSAFAGTVVGMNQVLGQIDAPASLLLQKEPPKDLEEKWMATSCLNCSARCAIRVRIVNGQAIKITGNPVSLVSEGKICPRAHIGLQVLYDPDRLTYPLKRTVKEKGKEIDPQMGSSIMGSSLGGGYPSPKIPERSCSAAQTSAFFWAE